MGSAAGRSLDRLLPASQASVSFHIHLPTGMASLQSVSPFVRCMRCRHCKSRFAFLNSLLIRDIEL